MIGRAVIRGAAALAFWGALGVGAAAQAQDAPAAAKAFQYSLSPQEAAAGAHRFYATPDRKEWRRPEGGVGLPWTEMDAETRRAAEALMRAALSPEGWRVFEATRRRGGDAPALTLFGAPDDVSAPWGLRCVSRDLSINFTYRGAKLISATPLSYVVPLARDAQAFLAQIPKLPGGPAAAREKALGFVLSPTPEPFRREMARALAERGALSSGYESGQVQILQGGGTQLALETIENGVLLMTLKDEAADFGARP